MKKAAAKTKKTKKAKRSYDNSTRAQASLATQKLIVETFVKMLVARKGEDVRIEEVAKTAGVSERTVFRFFKDKKALHDATGNYLTGYLQFSADELKGRDLQSFAKQSFIRFDKNENLTLAYLFSPFGQEVRTLFRKKLNQMLIEKIREDHKIGSSKEDQVRLALIVSLINAKLWYDIRTDFGYSGEEIGGAVAWAIGKLL